VKKLREMSEEVEDVQKRKQIENMKSIIMSPTTKFSKTFFSSVTVSKSKDEEEEKEEGAFVSTKLCGDMELGEIKKETRRLSDQVPVRKNPSHKSVSEKLSRNLLKEEKKRSSSDMDRVKKVRSTSSDQPSQFTSLVSQTTSTLLHVKLPRFLGGTTDSMETLEFEDISELDVLNWTERLLMAVEITAAVEYLHNQTPPILHRDIKPANIMPRWIRYGVG